MFNKIVLGLFVLFFLAGCSHKMDESTHAHMKHRIMFQTVAEKDAVLVQEGKEKYHCHICNMHLVKFYKTSYMAEGKIVNINTVLSIVWLII